MDSSVLSIPAHQHFDAFWEKKLNYVPFYKQELMIYELSVEEARERNFENEIHELRNQLTRSVGAISEMESLRRAVEKSERQRAQLSDHLEVRVKVCFITLF